MVTCVGVSKVFQHNTHDLGIVPAYSCSQWDLPVLVSSVDVTVFIVKDVDRLDITETHRPNQCFVAARSRVIRARSLNPAVFQRGIFVA